MVSGRKRGVQYNVCVSACMCVTGGGRGGGSELYLFIYFSCFSCFSAAFLEVCCSRCPMLGRVTLVWLGLAWFRFVWLGEGVGGDFSRAVLDADGRLSIKHNNRLKLTG